MTDTDYEIARIAKEEAIKNGEKKEPSELQKKCVEESLIRNGCNTNSFRIAEGLEPINEIELFINTLKEIFGSIKDILKKYIDTGEDNYDLIALWIIGTYTHEVFSSFPYLFFNAMKGSGKSRTIKLITCLSENGKLVMDLTDAVLFRTANGSTLGIDEFENVSSKDKQTLRTLLNAAYKKGVKVARMKKIKMKNELGLQEEKLGVEEFEVYAPIVMANISGMDSVLEDRCITIIHERSTDERINRLLEDFDNDTQILDTKGRLSVQLVKLVQLVQSKNIIRDWNDFVGIKSNPETTQTTSTTQITQDKLSIFEKIYSSNIKGRHLELFFPLFILASIMGDDLFDKIIETAKNIVSIKKNDDLAESRDVAFIEFISRQEITLTFVSVKDLTIQFREYMQEEDEQYQTITTRWVGRALKRLNLVIEKRRLGQGIQVILNIAKAKEKMGLFRTNNTPNNTE
jgi:hypothetical protein